MSGSKGGRRMISVSLKANREYIQKLAVLAKVLDEEMGTMVRQALDEKYGDKLAMINTMTGSVHNETSATK